MPGEYLSTFKILNHETDIRSYHHASDDIPHMGGVKTPTHLHSVKNSTDKTVILKNQEHFSIQDAVNQQVQACTQSVDVDLGCGTITCMAIASTCLEAASMALSCANATLSAAIQALDAGLNPCCLCPE
jgi:hypothetical protein